MAGPVPNRRNAALPRKRARKISRLVVVNPSKGLNNLVSPLLIDNREMSDMLNMEFDEGGVLRKRAGYSAVGAALTGAKGLGAFVTESLNYVVTVDGTSLKYLSGGAWNTVSGATFTAAQETNFSQARSKVYIWNGTDGGASWDGTTLTRPGTMPKGKFGIFYQDKHIVSGVAGQPNRVYISQNDDASAFTRAAGSLNNSTEVPGATVFTGTTANFIDVRKDDGDFITAIGLFQDVLIVFKKNSIFQLDFDASGAPIVTPITYATGCLSQKSVVGVENDLLFLSSEGVRRIGNDPGYLSTSGSTIRTHILSIRVNPTILSINRQYAVKASAVFVNNEYVLSFPTGTNTSPDTTLVYDNRFDGWLKWDTITPSAQLRYYDSNNGLHYYWLKADGTQMYEVIAGQYNDAGSAISSYIVGKAQDAGAPDLTKRWVDQTFMFRSLSGLITVTEYTDGGTQAGQAVIGGTTSDGMGLKPLGTLAFGVGTGSSTGTTTNTDIAERLIIGQNSRTLKYKIANSRLNENFVFLGYTIGYYVYSHFLFDSSYKIYT